jgi:hypothetical protein
MEDIGNLFSIMGKNGFVFESTTISVVVNITLLRFNDHMNMGKIVKEKKIKKIRDPTRPYRKSLVENKSKKLRFISLYHEKNMNANIGIDEKMSINPNALQLTSR